MSHLAVRTALVALICSIVVSMQWWIGDATIYAPQLEALRGIAHQSILDNRVPGGRRWSEVGAAALNIRVGTVYLAEGLRQLTGLPIAVVYKSMDTVFLFASLLALVAYLRVWLPAIYALAGLLYLTTMLPLTYLLHAFQPWDRLQMLFWLGLLTLTLRRRPAWLGVVLVVSLIVKFDTILFPILYAMAHAGRGQHRRVAAESAMLLLLAGLTYLTLLRLFPAPLEPARFSLEVAHTQVLINLAALDFRHPTLLALMLPTLLALWNWRALPRFHRACLAFALLMSGVWFVFTNYTEVRAQVGVLLLVLPACLLTLQQRWGTAATTAPR